MGRNRVVPGLETGNRRCDDVLRSRRKRDVVASRELEAAVVNDVVVLPLFVLRFSMNASASGVGANFDRTPRI